MSTTSGRAEQRSERSTNARKAPATPDRCFYCSQIVGTPHARDCVIVKKIVRLRWTVDVDIEVPHSWSKEEIIEYESGQSTVWHMVADSEYNDDRLEYVGVVDETPRRELRKVSSSELEKR
jgi:hypothetical protein